MAGLFDTLTIGKRGLNVQQANINTTSHNIANSSTTGYSRQRAVVETTRPFGGTSRWETLQGGQVGTGAEVSTIQRIRDTFLDYQVRDQTTDTNTLKYENEYLTKIDDILGESSDTGIQAALSDFYKKLQTLSGDPVNSRTVAVETAKTLASKINNAYTQMENEKKNAQSELSTDVTEVNDLLDKVNAINKQISGISSLGLSPNDLMDTRDNYLDQLSEKFGISVDREKYETMDVSATSGSNTLSLVDGKDLTGANCNRLSYVTDAKVDNAGANLTITYAVSGDKTNTKTITIAGAATGTDKAALQKIANDALKNRVLIGDKDGIVVGTNVLGSTGTKLVGASVAVSTGNITMNLNDYNASGSNVAFAAGKGKVGAEQTVQDDIQDSMNKLDKFAAALAYTVNAIETGTTNGSLDSNLSNNEPLFVNKDYTGIVNADKDMGINAKNIAINSVIDADKSKLNCGLTLTSGSGDGKRALAMANTLSLNMDLSTFKVTSSTTRASFFDTVANNGSGVSFDSTTINGAIYNDLNLKGSSSGLTLSNYFKEDVVGSLASKNEGLESKYSNAQSQLAIYENDRLGVSGVSLDEESANLVQYQHAYAANAKVISTVDELLDVVINGLKR